MSHVVQSLSARNPPRIKRGYYGRGGAQPLNNHTQPSRHRFLRDIETWNGRPLGHSVEPADNQKPMRGLFFCDHDKIGVDAEKETISP